MTDEADTHRDPKPPPLLAMPMSWWIRIGLAVVGLVLLGISCVAVLYAGDGLGTAALVTVGGAMLLVAGLGRWPSRVTWGDRSAEWALVALASSENPEVREEVQETVATMASNPFSHPNPFAPRARVAEPPWESVSSDAAMATVRAAIPPDATVRTTDLHVPWMDFEVAPRPDAPAGESVGVQIVHTPGLRSSEIRTKVGGGTRDYGASVVVIVNPARSVTSADLDHGVSNGSWGVLLSDHDRLRKVFKSALGYASRVAKGGSS